MTRLQLRNYIKTEAIANPSYSIEETLENCAFPFVDIDTKEPRFSVAYVLKLKHDDDSRNHTTVLAYDGSEYFFWCGDTFLEKGKKSRAVAKNEIATASATVKNSKKAKEDMEKNYGHFSETSTECHFWRSWKGKGSLCSHVKHMLNTVSEEILDNLENAFKKYDSKEKTTKPKEESAVYDRYAFKKHLLITGPKGFGKTYGVYKYFDDKNISEKDRFIVGGFEGLESIDLLGQNVPYIKEVKKENKQLKIVANNSFVSEDAKSEHIQDLVWTDGALTAAFRNAEKGNKTVLLIDELLRIPGRELSILIASLTPDNKGYYTLSTRKILKLDEDGCGVEETIKVKQENLWVVATTNIGASYDVEELESALEDRFMIVHKSSKREIVKKAVKANTDAKKYSSDEVTNLMNFFDEIAKYKKQENLSKTINTRHLCEIVQISENEGDIPEIVKDYALKWVGRDIEGEPLKNEYSLVISAINKFWKTSFDGVYDA